MRVAVFTSGPPSSTGPAVYAADLLPRLAEEVSLTVVSAHPLDWDLPTITASRFRPDDHDLAVFMLSNHRDLVPAYHWACRVPGVTVWHDAVVHGVLAARAPSAEAEALAERFGPERARSLLRAREGGLRSGWDTFLMHLLDRPLRISHAGVVHSRHARHLLESELPGVPVHIVPMHGGRARPRRDRLQARAVLGLRDDEIAVGVVGFAGPHKGLAESLQAFARARAHLRRGGGRLRLVLAGSVSGAPVVDTTVRELDIDDAVRSEHLDDEGFLCVLGALDMIVHLRRPTAGESSLLIAQAQRIGCPVITSDIGSFAEVEAAVRVSPGPAEVEHVAAAIEHLARCPACRSTRAASAMAGARARDPGHAAARYLAVFEDVLRATGRPVAAATSTRNPPAESLRGTPRTEARHRGRVSPGRSLRVGVCAPHVPLASGGMERLTQELWRELRRRGHVADLLRVPYAPYSRAGVVRGAMGWRLLDLAPREGGGFDVVIPTAFPSYFVRHPHKVTWLVAQYRQVYDLSGTEYAAAAWLRDATWRAAVREADSVSLGESAALFSISANVSRRLREHNGLEAVVLHPPPPVVRERSTTFGDAIVSIGRLDGLKRHDLLIDAMARTRTGARCVIIGTGVDEAALRRRIADLGLADRVTLAGWVDDDGLRRAYADARAVFYGPYDEDLGLVAMEALAAGKPVVTLRDSGGVLEFVEDGVNGWVTEPDPDGLAAAIDEVFTDAAGCAVRGAAGYERVASLSWDGVIDQLLAGA